MDTGARRLRIGPCAWFGLHASWHVFGPFVPVVGVGGLHVEYPFTASSRVFLAESGVGVEFAFEVGVDAALELVGGARQLLVMVGARRGCGRGAS